MPADAHRGPSPDLDRTRPAEESGAVSPPRPPSNDTLQQQRNEENSATDLNPKSLASAHRTLPSKIAMRDDRLVLYLNSIKLAVEASLLRSNRPSLVWSN